MLDFLLTLLFFSFTILTIPIFGIIYIILRVSKTIWLACISILHPEVEFLQTSTVRTILDTHRNQGIISVLLAIKGQAQPETVRRHLQEVVKRRDKSGNLTFPRLRHCLVTKCGNYAWHSSKFDLDQNLTVAPPTYKGRSVTEYNIQEYICDIISKYLPVGIPPWQLIIIPSAEDQHYILLKLHHILLSEGLNIGDLLPLIPPTRLSTGHFIPKSPLVQVLPKPQAIPQLNQKLAEELTNRWNEFISNYDPLEHTKFLKNNPGFFEFQAIAFITFMATLKECRKGFRNIKNDYFSRVKFFLITIKKEAVKRQVTFPTLICSVFVTLNPLNICSFLFWNSLNLLFLCFLRIPARIYIESVALFNCLTVNYCQYSHTIVGTLYNYVPLIVNSLKEVISYFSMVFKAPRTIIQDILLQKESFQTITLCGRKSVAWSEPVKIDQIRQIAKSTGVSEIEVVLTAISACISRYFVQTKHWIPHDLPVTMRNVNSNYIFATGTNVRPEDSVSGILCINLPILDPEKDLSLLEILVEIKSNFQVVLKRQGLSHLLSLCQTKFGLFTKFLPSAMVSVYLKYLSRKYAISITEITSKYPNVKQRTLWGQEVNDVVFWRPPHANTSVSLCLNEYGDQVKLAVMCDSQLMPHHPIFATGFPDYIQELYRAAGLQ